MAKKINPLSEKGLGKRMSAVAKIRELEALMANVPQYVVNSKGEKTPMNEAAGKKPTPSEYFFVADYDPEDPDMFDNEMVGDPIDYSPEGLQQAIELLTQMKQKNPNYNIYRRKYDEGGGSSEEEIIEDYYNYNFPNKK
jgi:hypothetical protein